MDIIISNGSQKPIYEQIYEQIVIAIATGNIKPNECLPSMRAMAKELNVSVITTQKTYEKLESAGYTYTIPGKGCFVSERNQSGECDKFDLVSAKLNEQIDYFKSLGISLEDTQKLLAEVWKK